MIEPSREFSEQSRIPVEIPDQCRRCITLARIAFTHDSLEEKIQLARKEDESGALMQRWIAQTAKVGEMSLADAEEFVESREARLKAEFDEELNKMNHARNAQLAFARQVIGHCEHGLVRMVSVTDGVEMGAEVCGSTEPERVRGFSDAEIVRVVRNPVKADVTP
ncbi:MAG TPA: hypothetical protein VLH14_02185 [Patescibacteria group bacterium]|nr:hypothetical protein [Patescibacteria group bacterium]